MPTKPEEAKNLEELGTSLPIERLKILSLLSEKRWFRKTDFEIQKKTLTLPDDFEGFLAELTTRRESYGGVDILRLLDIQRGNYNGIALFEVRSSHTNQIFTYEYVCQKYGRNPGYRGLILLEVKGEIRYFILRTTEKFAIGQTIYETIGGYVQFRGNQLVNIPKNVEDSLKKQFGLADLTVKRFIDLGLVTIDPGSHLSTVSIFGAVIDMSDVPVERIEQRTFHTKSLDFELIVEPIDRLREYIHKVDESFFLACVIRLVSMGIIRF